MKTLPKLSIVALLVLAIGCQSLYTGTVTITKVVDAAMKDWAAASAAGQSTPAIDGAVSDAHDKYRMACGILEKALIAYKTNGDAAGYEKALLAVKAAADSLVAAIVPILTAKRGGELKTLLAKAHTP